MFKSVYSNNWLSTFSHLLPRILLDLYNNNGGVPRGVSCLSLLGVTPFLAQHPVDPCDDIMHEVGCILGAMLLKSIPSQSQLGWHTDVILIITHVTWPGHVYETHPFLRKSTTLTHSLAWCRPITLLSGHLHLESTIIPNLSKFVRYYEILS